MYMQNVYKIPFLGFSDLLPSDGPHSGFLATYIGCKNTLVTTRLCWYLSLNTKYPSKRSSVYSTSQNRESRWTVHVLAISKIKKIYFNWIFFSLNIKESSSRVYQYYINFTASSSLWTADAFPVVASLPWRVRSDDRKCVCCSQAMQVVNREKYLYTFLNKNILHLCFSLGKKLPSSLKSQCKAWEIM